jgi:hypothetical protein
MSFSLWKCSKVKPIETCRIGGNKKNPIDLKKSKVESFGKKISRRTKMG